MFVNSVEVISSKLNNINLDQFNISSNMHPKETHVCGKNQLPLLNITPTNSSQKVSEGGSSATFNNPYLLKPNHVIPATPPPQIEQKSDNVFLQRIG